MTDEPQDLPEPEPTTAPAARRAGRTTRWIATGATALTGVFAGVAWQVPPSTASTLRTPTSQRAPVRPAATTSARRAAGPAAGPSAAPASAAHADLGVAALAPPAQPPRSANDRVPVAFSGAS